MQKRISIILILILSFSLIASSALGYADCGTRCCCQPARMGHGQATHSKGTAENISFLKAAGCCSGSMATTCKVARGSVESLPETIATTVRSEGPDLSGIGLASINLTIEGVLPGIYARGPDPWLKTQSIPIYLQNLAFLC